MTHVFPVPILNDKACHIPLKYKCSDALSRKSACENGNAEGGVGFEDGAH